MKFTTGST